MMTASSSPTRSPTEETSISLRSRRKTNRIATGKHKKTERLQNKS
jgi:hypothetical protein